MAFNTPSFNAQDRTFFESLNITKTPHLILTAETEDFEPQIEQQWKNEGFDCQYVPLLNGGNDFATRLKQAGETCGLGEYYAFSLDTNRSFCLAFGEAASLVLDYFRQPSTPRLCGIIAYYPSTIPQPQGTHYPPSIQVLVHLAGSSVNIFHTSEVLGIQGKRKSVPKNVGAGLGYGGIIPDLSYQAYAYSSREPGFAESDLDEFDPVAADLAFARSLATLKKAFRIDNSLQIETLRDRFVDAINVALEHPPEVKQHLVEDSQVLNLPTLTGGSTAQDLEKFYSTLFSPLPPSYTSRLISRTVGTNNRLVDELVVSFTHSQPIPWILPGIPSTGRNVEIAMCSVVCMAGGKLESEHVYWDQASVLMQVGLLDRERLVPQAWRKRGVKRLPMVGVEAARALLRKGRKHS